MGTKELLEQANERVKNINKAMQELEAFEGVMNVVEYPDSKVSISGKSTTYLHTVLNDEIMSSLKVTVLKTLTDEKHRRVEELEQMINPAKKDKVIEVKLTEPVNKVADASEVTRSFIEDVSKVVDQLDLPRPLTVEVIKELYHDKDMTLDQVASQVGTSRTALYKFVTDNGLRKPGKKEQETFRDTKVQASKKKPR